MTSWWDESRQKIGGDTPTWLTAPMVALPHIHLTPEPAGDMWLAKVILDGSWESLELPLAGVMTLLLEWRNDPEATLRHYWGLSPPVSRGARAPEAAVEIIMTTVAKPEDLDL